MALRDAVLTALLDGESSGYDLAKGFDASVANYWMATPQQLYRELDRLAEEGLIRARVVHQERRPNKRIYSLTRAGRDAIESFTAQPPKASMIRGELLVKVQAVDAGDAAAVREFVADSVRRANAKLEHYERLRSRLLDGRSEEKYLATTERLGPYLTLLRGISFEQENIRWAEHALGVIERRMRRPNSPPYLDAAAGAATPLG